MWSSISQGNPHSSERQSLWRESADLPHTAWFDCLALPCWVMGSWVVLFFFYFIFFINSIPLFSGPLCSVLIRLVPIWSVGFRQFCRVPSCLVRPSCFQPEPFYPAHFSSIYFSSRLFYSVRTKVSPFWSCWFWCSNRMLPLQEWHHLSVPSTTITNHFLQK